MLVGGGRAGNASGQLLSKRAYLVVSDVVLQVMKKLGPDGWIEA